MQFTVFRWRMQYIIVRTNTTVQVAWCCHSQRTRCPNVEHASSTNVWCSDEICTKQSAGLSLKQTARGIGEHCVHDHIRYNIYCNIHVICMHKIIKHTCTIYTHSAEDPKGCNLFWASNPMKNALL